MKPFDRRVRWLAYQHLVRTGLAPTAAELASTAEVPVAGVEASLERLQDAHALALAPSTRNVWMAHPFSAVPTAFACETKQRRYYANCAWDVLSIPPLLGADARSLGRCAESGASLDFRFQAGALVDDGDAVVQLIVPPRRFWENVGYT